MSGVKRVMNEEYLAKISADGVEFASAYASIGSNQQRLILELMQFPGGKGMS